MNWIKKFALFCLATFALIIILIGCIIYFYGDDIKEYAFNTLREELNKDITVDKTNFSGLSSFPNVGLEFTNLYSPGYTKNDTLIFAPKVGIAFNLIDLIKGNIEIEKITVTDAKIQILRDKNGNSNYNLSEKKSTSESSTLSINKLKLKNVVLSYIDNKSSTEIDALFVNFNIKGIIKNEIIELNTNGNAIVNRIYADKTEWANKSTTLQTVALLSINQAENSVHFNKSNITLDDNKLLLDGTIITLNSYNQYQLDISSEKLILNKFLKLIPEKYNSLFANYEATGEASASCTLSGSDAKGEGILTKICFNSKNSNLKLKKNDTEVKLNKIDGCYTWSPNNSNDILTINHYDIAVQGESLAGSLNIENFNDPKLSISAEGKLNLSTLTKFTRIDTLEMADGLLGLNISFEGKLKKVETYKSNGKVELKEVALAFKNNPLLLKSFNGIFELDNNNIQVKDFSGNLNKSDVLINGIVTNLYDFLFLRDNRLQIDASLSSNYLDLNTIWNSETSNNDTTFTVNFSDGLKVKLDLNLGEFYFKKFEAKNVIGNVELKEQILSTNEISMNTMDGSAKIKGKIDASEENVVIHTYTTVDNLDIHQLFYQVGNFGQKVVKYQNLKGLVTADITFNSTWSKSLEADLDKVYAKSKFIIENGELNDFEPMLALSKYVKGTDLKQVKFSTLKNSIEIESQKIYFPSMEINTSALDIVASGIHTFDNDIDYQLQLLISQLIGNKVEDLNTEFGEIEDDGLGRSKLFLTMTGTVEDPQFAIDKKALGNKIAEDIKSEKEELRNLLHGEFGKNKNKQNPKSQSSKTESNNQSGFDIEDEEEDFEIIED